MEKFDIRKHKYLLVLLFIFILFMLVIANAYKYLPTSIDSYKIKTEQISELEPLAENVNYTTTTESLEQNTSIEEVSSEEISEDEN